jgi:hypothetical protein
LVFIKNLSEFIIYLRMKLREVLSQGSPGSCGSSALELGTCCGESKGNFTSGNLLPSFN